jgi:hypothetical protein
MVDNSTQGEMLSLLFIITRNIYLYFFDRGEKIGEKTGKFM